MNRQYYCLFVVLFFVVFARAAAAEHTYNILFIQSYTSQTPWHNDLNEGLTKGFKENGLKVNITTEYLDADFWSFSSEKVIMQRFCQRARDRKTDMIITASFLHSFLFRRFVALPSSGCVFRNQISR